MDFTHSPHAKALRRQLDAFMQRYLLPYNAAWHRSVADGIYPPPFLEDLKELAREEGLWNLYLPGLKVDEPGTRLCNLDYAPLAETMGRLPWASEVFNCSAPDTGNMELLHRFSTPVQRERWLIPLLDGRIRSAFAMSEPDVASSDPTNLQATVRREGGQLVLNGRKWFITGAAHPNCKLLVVMCRNHDDDSDNAQAVAHGMHSMVLLPLDTPGVQVVRNIPVLHHHSPEGHCEILLRDVHVPDDHLLGDWGHGFAMAQARLGPGRVHHWQYLSGFSNVQDWIAESRIEIDQARLLVLHAAWLLDLGTVDPALLRAQIAAVKVVAARLQTRGRGPRDAGLRRHGPVARYTAGLFLDLGPGPAPDGWARRSAPSHGRAARAGTGARTHRAMSAWFTTPEQLQAPPRIRSYESSEGGKITRSPSPPKNPAGPV